MDDGSYTSALLYACVLRTGTAAPLLLSHGIQCDILHIVREYRQGHCYLSNSCCGQSIPHFHLALLSGKAGVSIHCLFFASPSG
jgi:hypothetical protein